MIIRPGRPEDIPLLIRFRHEASAWLGERGIDQWSEPWPTADEMAESMLRDIQARQTYVLWEDEDSAAATLTIGRWADPDLWTAAEAGEPAAYLHKLIVARLHATQGLGVELIDWAATQAAQANLDWLRLDAWTTNRQLQQYYRDQGFRHVRTTELVHNQSGALFERRSEVVATPRIRSMSAAQALAAGPRPNCTSD